MPIRCTALPPHQPHYPKAQLPAFKNSLLQRGGVDARSVQKGFTICRCCEKINPQRIGTNKDVFRCPVELTMRIALLTS